jgi:transposase
MRWRPLGADGNEEALAAIFGIGAAHHIPFWMGQVVLRLELSLLSRTAIRYLIVAHEVTNVGNDTAHLANTVQAAKAALHVDKLEAVADRGYFNGEEILACEQGDITVTLPKPQRSGAKSEGRFGKQDFVYLANENVYRCPAGATLTYRYTNEEHGQTLYRYWADACRTCPIKAQYTTERERRITRWEHEEIVEAVQERLDKNPEGCRSQRPTASTISRSQ